MNTISSHSLIIFFQKMPSTKSVYLTLYVMFSKPQRASGSGMGTFTAVQSYLFTEIQMNKIEINHKYITIHTSHFSGYIVTAEGINCCSKSANVLLFGSLGNNLYQGPSVTVKVYLSSIHSEIRDYEAVRRNPFSTFLTMTCT